MEGSTHSSIYVAPLQITKDHSRSASRLSSCGARQSSGELTPPLTPDEDVSSFAQQVDFYTFLQAVYPYHPLTEIEDPSSVILPLNAGEVILIHSIHSNGWADGTLLSTGERGWLPTNHCQGYASDPINPLLKALTVFWDLSKNFEAGDHNIINRSDFVRGFLAGVRCLLERTDCFNKESQNVISSYRIHKHRKALLSDFSAFVKATKSLKFSDEYDTEGINVTELVLKAFKTVTRAVKFLDAWEAHQQTLAVHSNHGPVPPTPPADHDAFGNLVANSVGHHARRNSGIVTKEQTDSNARPRHNRASQTYIRPGSASSCSQPTRPLSKQGLAPVGHRAYCALHSASLNLASTKLDALHNTYLTHLGYFAGLQVQSRSSTESLFTTKQAVIACRDLLDLVSEIWERDHRRSNVLRYARDEMFLRIGELAHAARDAFRPLRSDEDDVQAPSDGHSLMEAATACVRAAGECAAECRFIIERIGDFEYLELDSGVSQFDATHNPGASTEPLTSVHEEQASSDWETSPSSTSEVSEQFPAPPARVLQPDFSAAVVTPTPSNYHDDQLDSTEKRPESWRRSSAELLPPLPVFPSNLLPQSEQHQFQRSDNSSAMVESDGIMRPREESFGFSSAGGSSGCLANLRNSETEMSQTSTRATSPDVTFNSNNRNESFTSCADSQASGDRDSDEMECDLLEQTYAHELAFNKDGQVIGGTLPALIERLTTPDCTPDATFVATFYLTFRLFATASQFAEALIDRFNYVGDHPRISAQVRLRVSNIFKGWLESHWRNDCDKSALETIQNFATRQLQIVLPTAGKRLTSLAEQVSNTDRPLVPRLISSIGKTNTSIAHYVPPDTPLPPSLLSKSQMNALKAWKLGSGSISILEIDPLEMARQLTIKESQIFCSILPEELLASEWNKQSGSLAVNVRALSRLSNDLNNLVTDNILQIEDPKRRATIIKQWTKIGEKLLELSNYHSLASIICSLTQSTIMRLKRTWEYVSTKTKGRLDRLKGIINHERNYASMRQIFQNQTPPCVPWVGLYLTDLTFVDAGNTTTRQLPGVACEDSKTLINFDKHMKTARIISELQRFQIPYRLTEVPELQTWLQDQLVRVRTVDQTTLTKDYYRRSLLLEPRAVPETQTPSGKDKFEMLSFLNNRYKNHPAASAACTA
ncbi:uncharacterized protein KY384_006827 [Bacidia gigantensis]|uniref:uncharacterized protein n=1 Tax=Bacidia gigantensis TaxID=2732470 RepID=UPI001D038C94|nr:uncharacterized protein KY384_006827 [Bacidia gigantensis]KAG8527911.1 hypothetical protein KY384_006827 [Bacidia gigantensis]